MKINLQSQPLFTFLLAGCLCVILVAVSTDAEARSRSKTRTKTEWDKSANECMQVFEEFDLVPLEQVTQCTALWATYRSVEKIRASQRFILVKAFKYLFEKGDAGQSWIGYNALKRLGEAPEGEGVRSDSSGSMGPSPGRMGERPGGNPAIGGRAVPSQAAPVAAAPSKRAAYNPPKATKGEHERARKLNNKGSKAAKKKQYDNALSQFEQAIKWSPRYETALFNAAGMYALTGNIESCVRYLTFLRDLGTEDAMEYLHQARVNKRFNRAHDSQGFKSATGYARIKLLNGKGVYGEDEVDRIEEYFAKARHRVEEMTHDPHDREFPIIWHKQGVARNTAFILSKLVNHPRTMLVTIDWETEFDIVVTWGDTFEMDPRTQQPMVKEYEMKDPDSSAQNALEQQDKALREPEKFSREVDKKARTPERIQSSAEQSINRVENTVNVIEKTGSTIERGGGLID